MDYFKFIFIVYFRYIRSLTCNTDHTDPRSIDPWWRSVWTPECSEDACPCLQDNQDSQYQNLLPEILAWNQSLEQ